MLFTCIKDTAQLQSLLFHFSINSSYCLLKLRFKKEPPIPVKQKNKKGYAGVGACP